MLAFGQIGIRIAVRVMGAGRWGREDLFPWISKISANKGCFLTFQKKNNFTTYRPLKKFGKFP